MKKCKFCKKLLNKQETPESHQEVCGSIDDDEAEQMSQEDIKGMTEEID